MNVLITSIAIILTVISSPLAQASKIAWGLKVETFSGSSKEFDLIERNEKFNIPAVNLTPNLICHLLPEAIKEVTISEQEVRAYSRTLICVDTKKNISVGQTITCSSSVSTHSFANLTYMNDVKKKNGISFNARCTILTD